MRKITIIVEDDDFVSTTTADLFCQIEDVVFDSAREWLPRADHNLPDTPGAKDLRITVPWVENIRLDIVEK